MRLLFVDKKPEKNFCLYLTKNSRAYETIFFSHISQKMQDCPHLLIPEQIIFLIQ